MSKLSKAGHKVGKFLDSALGNVTGARDRGKAQDTADAALQDARDERTKFEDAETKANEEKTREKTKLNKKQMRSARSSFRRPGFLDSTVEGTSDVLG